MNVIHNIAIRKSASINWINPVSKFFNPINCDNHFVLFF